MTRGPGAAQEDGSATVSDRPAHGGDGGVARGRPTVRLARASGASRRLARETAPLPEHTT